MASYQVTLLPAQFSFVVRPDETVLAAALRQGIDFPFRCQQGVCGACVCRQEAGSVQYSPPEPAHQGQSMIYCCVATPSSDLVLRHPFIRGPAAN